MTGAQRLNLTLRVATETGVAAALATWGVQAGSSNAAKVALGGAAPAVVSVTYHTLVYLTGERLLKQPA